MSAADLPRAYGAPVLSALFRQAPEDFRVDEIDAFAPSGEGEHLLLTVEKRGMNTAFAAKRIAAWAGVAEMAVGYAGLKDRHAVTRQRFSVHLPKRVAPDLAGLQDEELRVIESHWHQRKLSRGALAGNRFILTLREVAGDREAVEARLRQIASGGIANYFGEQRFGRGIGGQDNVAAARRMFAGARVPREKRSIYLSAARSALFNSVLAARVAEGSWNRGLPGEVWMLEGSHSVFGPEPDSAELAARVAAQDIHPTGPMWGQGALRTGEAVLALEQALAAAEPELCAGLEAAGLRQERRALRMRVPELEWQWPQPATLELRLRLAPGAYATEVLAELGEVRAPTPPPSNVGAA